MSLVFEYATGVSFEDLFDSVVNDCLSKCRIEMDGNTKNFYTADNVLFASLSGLVNEETLTKYGKQYVLQELSNRILNIRRRIVAEIGD